MENKIKLEVVKVTTNEYLDYLGDALTLEQQKLGQDELYKAYQEYMKDNEPVLQLESDPEKPKSEEPNMAIGCGTVILILPILIIFAFLAGMEADFTTIIAVIGMLIWGGSYVGVGIHGKKVDRINAEKYEQEVRDVWQQNKEITQQFELDHASWSDALSQSETFYQQHDELIKKELIDFYSKNIIYPKYRNLPAIASFYEYFESGRCDSLEGNYGAYNIYEDEKRKDMIISQISEIIQNLEAIKENQYQLYQRIEDVLSKVSLAEMELRSLNGDVREMSKIAIINTYFNAVTASNIESMRYGQ